MDVLGDLLLRFVDESRVSVKGLQDSSQHKSLFRFEADGASRTILNGCWKPPLSV